MSDVLLDRFAGIFSYIWELLSLLAHARRLALLRQAARETRYTLERGFLEDHCILTAALGELRAMERELAGADLALERSQRAAAAAYHAAVASLERRLRTLRAPEPPRPTAQEKAAGQPQQPQQPQQEDQ